MLWFCCAPTGSPSTSLTPSSARASVRSAQRSRRVGSFCRWRWSAAAPTTSPSSSAARGTKPALLALGGREGRRSVIQLNLSREVVNPLGRSRVIAREEVGDLVGLAVLLLELLPQSRPFRGVEARLVHVAQPHAIRLILVLPAVARHKRGEAELATECGHLLCSRVFDLRHGDGGPGPQNLSDRALTHLTPHVLVRVM